MARPRASADQQVFAFQLWTRGLSVSATHLKIESEFVDSVSRATVGNWYKGFRSGENRSGKADRPFQWADMHKHGIPAEAGELLLETAFIIENSEIEPGSNWTRAINRMTFRHATWLWRVYHALGGRVFGMSAKDHIGPSCFLTDRERGDALPFEHWLAYGAAFAHAERIKEYTGISVDISSFETRLRYRPWESPFRLKHLPKQALSDQENMDLNFLVFRPEDRWPLTRPSKGKANERE